jgi:isoquinoline 1-oxidoreductase beta subunit
LLIDHAMRNTVVRPGFWRGVNTNQNAIYVECFIDELAHAAGQDPLAFRQKLLADHPKHLAVLNAVADRVGWSKPAPTGVHRGLAQFMGYGSYVAAAAEVSVANGRLKIHRIVAATNSAATRSIRRRSSGGLRARSCMASRLPSTANALSRTAAWSKRELRTPTT